MGSEVEVPTATQQRRRGKAPPIEMFSGEDLGIRLDDWLPSLQRAANWNNWTGLYPHSVLQASISILQSLYP